MYLSILPRILSSVIQWVSVALREEVREALPCEGKYLPHPYIRLLAVSRCSPVITQR